MIFNTRNFGVQSVKRLPIRRCCPGIPFGEVHLFGHIHEQRGHWDRVNGAFEGGVEYRPSPHTAQAAATG